MHDLPLCALNKNKQPFSKIGNLSFNYFPNIDDTITLTSSLKRIKLQRDESFAAVRSNLRLHFSYVFSSLVNDL